MASHFNGNLTVVRKQHDIIAWSGGTHWNNGEGK